MRVPVIDFELLVRSWWVLLLRGLTGILFGILTLLAPGLSLAVLVIFFGFYAIVDGVLAIASAFRYRAANGRTAAQIVQGIIGIAAGFVAFRMPGLTALALLYLVAAWAIVTGIFEVAAAIRLREVITGEWLLALSGIASVALGVVLMLFPGPGALALVLWIGAYALVSGALLTALSFRLRALGRSHPTSPHAAPAIA